MACITLCAISAAAQLEIGDNLKMHLNGNLGFGYSGVFGDESITSSHGQGFTGSGNLNGFYYHPNFLSFEVRPYYDRSQVNSDAQSINTGTGVGASVGLFSASYFPVSVSYGKDYSSSSEFRLAGVPGLYGDGASQTFSVTVSELLPKYPQLWATYFATSNSSSLVGVEGESHTKTKSFNLNSTYDLAGFNLNSYFSHQNSDSSSPSFLDAIAFNSASSTTSYGIAAHHRLPRSGSFGLSYGHATYGTSAGGDSSTNNFTGTIGLSPLKNVTVSGSSTYTTNLTVALAQSIIGQDGSLILRPDYGSNSLSLNSSVTWSIGYGLSTMGYVSHRLQNFAGGEYSDTQYGGVVNFRYSNRLFGLIYFGVGAVDMANKQGNTGASLTFNAGMNKKFGRWDTSADFSYGHNMQTLVVFATTSSYSYGASVRRRLNSEINWSSFFRGMHSGVTRYDGTGSHAENIATSLGWRRFAVSGTYSQSTGTALYTSTGILTPAPLGGLIADNLLVFNARSYGFTASSRLTRKLSVVGTYSKVKSDTLAGTNFSFNRGDRYGARLEYRLRKFSFIGAFQRTAQEISASTLPRQVVNSYSLTLTRWFDVF